jgi:formylmethanofuran dehydrogenase subunit B
LILFWFADPVSTHPRLLERLAKSKKQRKIIVVDEQETKTAKAADQFFQVASENAPALLAGLRGKLACVNFDLQDAQADKLLTAMKSAEYGAILYGQVEDDSAFDLTGDSLNLLIKRLNDETRFVGMKLRSDVNAQSGENVISWSSGYPFAVSYAHGIPRYNWLEHSAETILTRGECDAILFASGSDLQQVFAGLSRTAKEFLGSIPKIVLSPISEFQTDVVFHVGVPGLTESGEFCRNDDVSLGLSAITGAHETSAVHVLESLLKVLGEMA